MVTKNQTAKAEKNSQTTSLLDQVMEQTRFKPENEEVLQNLFLKC